ncbi:hypothetical protein BJ912DRAFT_944244 [Pholiota molesta]|nr:hypothetical protein BJ912DRAFT_944244 [Pholiota molesta]
MLVNYEKQNGVYKKYAQLPLTARPLDLLYFLFFAVNPSPSLLIIDLQWIYPPQLVPSFLPGLLDFYIDIAGPTHRRSRRSFWNNTHLGWFKTFIVLEAVFQIPVFILGLRALQKGSRSIYPLLAVYGASSATTTLACLTTVLQTPNLSTEVFVKGAAGITQEQRLLLLSSYVPFFLIPLIMAVDMSMRVAKLAKKGMEAENEEKWK